MDVKIIQQALSTKGFPLVPDGIPGKKTMAAVDAALVQGQVNPENWSDARRLIAIEQLIYKGLKIEVGEVDGLVGEQTRYARTVHAAREKNGGKVDPKVELWRDEDKPAPVTTVKSPWPRQAQCTEFFGAVGTNQTTLTLPCPFRIAWEPDKTVMRASCHVKVRDAFDRIWRGALNHYGYEEFKRLRLDMFGGCLNVRKMRGGSAWSMHSWGIAWDIDPDRNQLKWNRAQATIDDPPYKKFWELVYAEGLIGLGPERGFDWMHVQAARL